MTLAFPNSLRDRLLVIAGVMIVVAMAVALAVMSFTLVRFVTSQTDMRLDAQAQSIAAALRPGRGGGLALTGNLDSPPFDRPNSGWVWQVRVGEEVRFQSRSLRDRHPLVLGSGREDEPAERPRRGPFRTRLVGLEEGERLRARLLSTAIEGVPVEIVVAAPEHAIQAPLRDAIAPVAVSMMALAVGLLAATWIQVRWGLKPLGELRLALQAVRSGGATRIPDAQPSEIRPLAGELNALLEENALGLDRARRHVANLAHGLKTPLADLALFLESSERDPDGAARALVDDMDRRIRHHLARARAAAIGRPARAATPLRPHGADLVAALGRIYRERDLTVTATVSDEAIVAVEPQDLDEMIGNLLDNACKWARTRVDMSARAVPRGIELSIEDDGPGIGTHDTQTALSPGRRLDEMQPGHGFGLPITRELAELYGGTFRIERSPLGGVAARLLLPVPLG